MEDSAYVATEWPRTAPSSWWRRTCVKHFRDSDLMDMKDTMSKELIEEARAPTAPIACATLPGDAQDH